MVLCCVGKSTKLRLRDYTVSPCHPGFLSPPPTSFSLIPSLLLTSQFLSLYYTPPSFLSLLSPSNCPSTPPLLPSVCLLQVGWLVAMSMVLRVQCPQPQPSAPTNLIFVWPVIQTKELWPNCLSFSLSLSLSLSLYPSLTLCYSCTLLHSPPLSSSLFCSSSLSVSLSLPETASGLIAQDVRQLHGPQCRGRALLPPPGLPSLLLLSSIPLMLICAEAQH